MPLHVRPDAIENAAHFYDRSGQTDSFAENLGAIWGRKDGLADIEPDLAAINIKCGYDFNVTRPIRTDLAMHQTHSVAIGGGGSIKVDSLNQRAGTIADSDNSDPDLSHGQSGKTTQSEVLGARCSFGISQGEKARPGKKNQRISKKNAQILGGEFY